MQAFDLNQMRSDDGPQRVRYLEFLREPSMSVGLYTLTAGAVDPQKPHSEDEVYYVIRGQGMITVGTEQRLVEPGTIVFVGAGVEHRFHDITQDLELLVFFAPAEHTTAHGV